jgi:hypothetical protein
MCKMNEKNAGEVNPFYTFYELQSFLEEYHNIILDCADIGPKPLLSFFKDIPFKEALSPEEYKNYVIMVMTKLLVHKKESLFKMMFDLDLIENNRERIYEISQILLIVGGNMPWAFSEFFQSEAGEKFKEKINSVIN